MQIAALVDADDPRAVEAYYWQDAPHERCRHDRIAPHLRKLLAHQPALIVCQGDDRFCAQVASAYSRSLRDHPLRLPLVPLRTGAPSELLAQSLNVPQDPSKAVFALRRALQRGKLQTTRLAPLRLTLSTWDACALAFHVGLGQVFSLAETLQRGTRVATLRLGNALLRQLRANLLDEAQLAATRPELRVVLDERALAQPPRYLLASSLALAPFGLTMHQGASLLRGLDLLDLLAELLHPARLLPSRLGALAKRAERFHRLVVDQFDGLLLDGHLVTPDHGAVLALEPGPVLTFATL